jgi:hypothetical protein
MNTLTERPMRASDFRQHYHPLPACPTWPRHWLLDHREGRNFLMMHLRRSKHAPEALRLCRNSLQFDAALDLMLDELELRDLPEPESFSETFRMNFKILKLITSVQMEQIRLRRS